MGSFAMECEAPGFHGNGLVRHRDIQHNRLGFSSQFLGFCVSEPCLMAARGGSRCCSTALQPPSICPNTSAGILILLHPLADGSGAQLPTVPLPSFLSFFPQLFPWVARIQPHISVVRKYLSRETLGIVALPFQPPAPLGRSELHNSSNIQTMVWQPAGLGITGNKEGKSLPGAVPAW